MGKCTTLELYSYTPTYLSTHTHVYTHAQRKKESGLRRSERGKKNRNKIEVESVHQMVYPANFSNRGLVTR